MAPKNKKPETKERTVRDDLCIKELKCKTERQKELVKSIRRKEVTICSGSAGTGKTFVTLNTALRLYKEGTCDKIILCKSVTSIPEEEIGFLKGNIEQKMEPFIMSYVGNLNKMLSPGMAERLFEEKVIEVLPLAYIRGLSIDNSIIILDESQNITMNIFKSVITRIGENSKMVFLGDCEQVDFRTDRKKLESALQYVTKIFDGEDYVGVVEFTQDDCVRNPIIPKVLDKLREFENENHK
jgi:phosphate starvation-inducible PhoH-like protein